MKEKTPPAPPHTPSDMCPLCNKQFKKQGMMIRKCECPWDKAFEFWPPLLRSTLRAMANVNGEPNV